jgi:hypothetical protein
MSLVINSVSGIRFVGYVSPDTAHVDLTWIFLPKMMQKAKERLRPTKRSVVGGFAPRPKSEAEENNAD